MKKFPFFSNSDCSDTANERFQTKTKLRENLKLVGEEGSKISETLVFLYIRSRLEGNSHLACLDDQIKTYNEILKAQNIQASSALPQPIEKKNISKEVLTDSKLLGETLEDANHAVIQYPREGYTNKLGECETEKHTVYFGHDLKDRSKCQFFDPEVEGGEFTKISCDKLINYMAAHFNRTYSSERPESEGEVTFSKRPTQR